MAYLACGSIGSAAFGDGPWRELFPGLCPGVSLEHAADMGQIIQGQCGHSVVEQSGSFTSPAQFSSKDSTERFLLCPVHT